MGNDMFLAYKGSMHKIGDDSGVGQSMAGKTVNPTADSSVVAGEGSEIFNDYSKRTYTSSGNITAGNIASGIYSHAEGRKTTASGSESHAEGSFTTASGNISHAEGYGTIASGSWSHAGGFNSKASGAIAFSYGYGTIAHSREVAIGMFNVDSSATDSDTSDSNTSLFIIGKGRSSNRSNVFRVTSSAIMGSTSFSSSGADYAEMFEWSDENPNNEDRVGRFVTIKDEKIRLASQSDPFILGIVSGSPTMIGDDPEDQWHNMFVTDIFGRPVYETVDIPDEFDDEGNIIRPAHTEEQQKVNPNYNNTEKYIGRQDRPEWAAVGLLGKLVTIDDGTCLPDHFCKPSSNGIATYSEKETKYYVLKRIDENHIKVLII